MKKTSLLFVLMFVAGIQGLLAQNAALTIQNGGGSGVQVTLYATAQGALTCSDIVTNTFTVPANTVVSWTDPCDFVTTGPGFAIFPSSLGSACPLSSLPAGYQWTYVQFSAIDPCSNNFSGKLGDNGISCNGAFTDISVVPGCFPLGDFATWQPRSAGSPMKDITIGFAY